jgi:hypothetical protein
MCNTALHKKFIEIPEVVFLREGTISIFVRRPLFAQMLRHTLTVEYLYVHCI